MSTVLSSDKLYSTLSDNTNETKIYVFNNTWYK